MSKTWTSTDPRWAALSGPQRVAAMALMEADRRNPSDARDAAGAMINRAAKSGTDLGEHVSGAIYQPTIEPAQQARLDSILKSPEYTDLSGWAERRAAGKEPDPVNGATHFLAPESTMLALTKQNPAKYHSWPQWTGYDPDTGEYHGVIKRDGSHAFLAPEGAYSAPGIAPVQQQANVAQNGAISGGQPAIPAQAIQAPPVIASAPPQATPATSPDAGNPILAMLGKLGTDDKGNSTAPQIDLSTPAPLQLRAPNNQAALLQALAARLGNRGLA